MRRIQVPAAAFAVIAASLAWLAPAVRGAQARFRGGVDLVTLNVTVTDGARYVTDLEQEHFEVFEDGVRQEMSFFARGRQPVALAVLLDTSASMEARIETAQEAAVGFARRMQAGDVMEVIEFNGQVKVLQPFTSDVEALERAIRSATVQGSTSLYNALYIALKSLQKARARSVDDIRREAVIVLSDGDDTSSLVAYDEVLDLAKRSETAIYAVGLRNGDGARRDFKEAEFVLRQLSQETGGRVFYPNALGELPRIYEQIAQELSSQYSIGYMSSNPQRNGAWRRISVRVANGLHGRTRQGYYAPADR